MAPLERRNSALGCAFDAMRRFKVPIYEACFFDLFLPCRANASSRELEQGASAKFTLLSERGAVDSEIPWGQKGPSRF
jgi:hypothetical protein